MAIPVDKGSGDFDENEAWHKSRFYRLSKKNKAVIGGVCGGVGALILIYLAACCRFPCRRGGRERRANGRALR